MIGDDYLRVKCFHRFSRLVRWHGIGQVHAHKSHVDILEPAHLGHAFSVTREIKALAAVGEDVAIAASFVVEKLPGRRTALQV